MVALVTVISLHSYHRGQTSVISFLDYYSCFLTGFTDAMDSAPPPSLSPQPHPQLSSRPHCRMTTWVTMQRVTMVPCPGYHVTRTLPRRKGANWIGDWDNGWNWDWQRQAGTCSHVLPHSAAATLTSSMSPKHATLTSGSFHWLFPLPGTLFPQEIHKTCSLTFFRSWLNDPPDWNLPWPPY